MQRKTAPSMRHVPALDGVRSLAIGGVFLFHLAPRSLGGGFTGVDVFFVLSGFLICSVILHEMRHCSFSLREFYVRRVQRLVPNAVMAVTFAATAAAVVLLPSQARTTAANAVSALFNASNFFIMKSFHSYWGDSAASAPLLHTWSLGVEEQFYILFPITLVLVLQRFRAFIPIVILAGISLLLCIGETASHPLVAFYMLPTRAGEPLIGAALAAFLTPGNMAHPIRTLKPSLVFASIGWLGMAAILAGFLVIPEGSFPGWWALIPTLGTLGVLLAIVAGGCGPARLLSLPPLVEIGKLSYSLYLWHWPLIVIGKEYAALHGYSTRKGAVLGAALSIVLAVLAYWAVEKPFRRRGPGRKLRLAALAAGFVACVGGCAALSLRPSVADPFHLFDQPRFSGLSYSVVNWDRQSTASTTRLYDAALPAEQTLPPRLWTEGGVIHAWGQTPPRVVVFGSSHALMYAPTIDSICQELKLSVAFFAADGTPVFFPTLPNPHFPTADAAASFDKARLDFVTQWHPDALLLIDKWDADASNPERFEEHLRSLMATFSPKVGRLIIFTQPPVLSFKGSANAREYVTRYYRVHRVLPAIRPDTREKFRQSSASIIESMAREFPNVTLVRPDKLFYRQDGSIRYADERKFLYADGDHLSDDGAQEVRELCLRAIESAEETRR